MILADPKTREEWLKLRLKGIGGSEAGAVLGCNKYKTNIDVFREKTGTPSNFKGNAATEYGTSAEEHIRNLFMLDHPEYSLEHHEYRMYANDNMPFIYATLDGELTRKSDGLKGILEVKTTQIHNPIQWRDWEGDLPMPQSYYCQLLHQLSATGWQFATMVVQIKYHKNGEMIKSIREHTIHRCDVLEDIAYLEEKEQLFWDCVLKKQEPNLILPSI